MFREQQASPSAGLATLLAFLVLAGLAVYGLISSVASQRPVIAIAAALVLVVTLVCLAGLFIVNPGDAKVLILFGSYKGTAKTAGFWWANPFLVKRKIS